VGDVDADAALATGRYGATVGAITQGPSGLETGMRRRSSDRGVSRRESDSDSRKQSYERLSLQDSPNNVDDDELQSCDKAPSMAEGGSVTRNGARLKFAALFLFAVAVWWLQQPAGQAGGPVASAVRRSPVAQQRASARASGSASHAATASSPQKSDLRSASSLSHAAVAAVATATTAATATTTTTTTEVVYLALG
jgi:hypothetical protein